MDCVWVPLSLKKKHTPAAVRLACWVGPFTGDICVAHHNNQYVIHSPNRALQFHLSQSLKTKIVLGTAKSSGHEAVRAAKKPSSSSVLVVAWCGDYGGHLGMGDTARYLQSGKRNARLNLLKMWREAERPVVIHIGNLGLFGIRVGGWCLVQDRALDWELMSTRTL